MTSKKLAVTYRHFRLRGYSAQGALSLARAVIQSHDREDLHFVWDEDAYADVSWMDKSQLADYRSGRLLVLSLVLYCGRDVVGALGGISVYDDYDGLEHRNDCQAELLAEYLGNERDCALAVAL